MSLVRAGGCSRGRWRWRRRPGGDRQRAGLWSSSPAWLVICNPLGRSIPGWVSRHRAEGCVPTLGAASLWNPAGGSPGCTAARREVGSDFKKSTSSPPASAPPHSPRPGPWVTLSSSASGGVGERGEHSSYTALACLSCGHSFAWGQGSGLPPSLASLLLLFPPTWQAQPTKSPFHIYN